MSVVHAAGGENVVVRAKGVVAVMMIVEDKKIERLAGTGEAIVMWGRPLFQSAKLLVMMGQKL